MIKLILLTFLAFNIQTVYAIEEYENQNIVKEMLYIYYDNPECANRVKTYTSPSLVDGNFFNINKQKPVQIYVTDSETVGNLTWYKAKIIDGAYEGDVYIAQDVFQVTFDGAKNYYLANNDRFSDEKLLKSCISNVSPPFRLQAIGRFDPNHSITLSEEDFIAAKAAIPKLSNTEICARYGYYLRDSTETAIEQKKVFINIIKREFSKRKLQVSNLNLIKQKQIKIKMNECELIASWGTAEKKNESAGNWGLDTQHVYGSNVYVYSRNGRITSWQK